MYELCKDILNVSFEIASKKSCIGMLPASLVICNYKTGAFLFTHSHHSYKQGLFEFCKSQQEINNHKNSGSGANLGHVLPFLEKGDYPKCDDGLHLLICVKDSETKRFLNDFRICSCLIKRFIKENVRLVTIQIGHNEYMKIYNIVKQ